jgi:signal transduction histidine kinase
MPGGGTLTISTRAAQDDEDLPGESAGTRPGSYVELDVRDTGTGMSPEVQSRIFDRFFTTKFDGSGTGLGLSTARGIIADAGGIIQVDSQEGRGSTFRVFLPAA